jgi:hypothetical protein
MPDTHELPDISPMQCARELLKEGAEMFGSDVKGLRELDYIGLAITLHPGVTTQFPAPDQVYHEITDAAARNLAIMAHGNTVAFEMVREIIDRNVLNGVPIHPDLRPICHALIMGQKVGPKRSGPKPGKEFGLKFVAVGVIEYLRDAYGIPETHGDGSEAASSAEVVRAALAEQGIFYSYNTIRDWTRREKQESFWLWRDALHDMFSHESLLTLGLSVSRHDYAMNPWGQFVPTHLMPPED